MARIATDPGAGPSGGGPSARPSAGRLARLALVVGMAAATLPGCGGCRSSTSPNTPQTPEDAEEALAERQERLSQKKRKPDFEVGFRRAESPLQQGPLLASQPHNTQPQQCLYKPGHWTAVTLPAKTNHFDLVGEFATTVLGGNSQPLELEGTAFHVGESRPIALSKGRPKIFDAVLFVPSDELGMDASCSIRGRRGSGGWQGRQRLTRMPSYQYHLVVLARLPSMYGYVRDLDSRKWPADLESNYAGEAYYRVWLLESSGRVALPEEGLFWTSIAYVLWDEADPGALSPQQQLALLDWLHWGGQLILSGPGTLDGLRDSFLAAYLPATSSGTCELTAADFEELSTRWTLPVGNKPGVPLAPTRAWAGVKLKVAPQGREVPGTGGLLVERCVGRGRIVASAFGLGERGFKSWPGRDGFFNGCLLGRGRRKFVRGDDDQLKVSWADRPEQRFDARRVSKLRYFTRDVVEEFSSYKVPGLGEPYGGPEEAHLGSDVASWNDSSLVAGAARKSLQAAAQIEIPRRDFVLWVVAGYLVVLVPVNWAIFRSLGRVEWAWAAAPVIAVVCTAVVIRMARLNIGFARSLTEIAVVELQEDYPRAHVTRYTALYTSLSTSYTFHSDDPAAQIRPFAKEGDDTEARFGRRELRYEYGSGVSLQGFRVRSNYTGLGHTEQMVDLGGSLLLVRRPGGTEELVNGTPYTVHGAGLLRRDEQGGFEAAWLGTLEPEAAARVNFQRDPEVDGAGSLWQERRGRSRVTAGQGADVELDLSVLFQLAQCASGPQSNQERLALLPGEVRLVGWLEDPEISGLRVEPAARQTQRVALLVAHLQYGFPPTPQPDVNTREDVAGDDSRVLLAP